MAKCMVVLGMHRSTTSLIAKGLVEAGVNMGDQMLPPDSGNPHGYWEDIEFLNMNKTILLWAGGDWNDPPSESAILALRTKRPSLIESIEKLIKRKQGAAGLWGWKDPRTVLTIGLYQPFLKEPIYVSCFRSSNAIAQSLHVRNQMPIAQGLELAYEYNKRLRAFLKKTG
jgi:hypothetical protein